MMALKGLLLYGAIGAAAYALLRNRMPECRVTPDLVDIPGMPPEARALLIGRSTAELVALRAAVTAGQIAVPPSLAPVVIGEAARLIATLRDVAAARGCRS